MAPEDEVVSTPESPPVVDAVGAGDGELTPATLGIELPDDHDEAIEALVDAVATARSAADRYLDDLQRLAAEFENYRKRMQRDHEQLVLRSSQRLIETLLPVLDSFDQAFAHEAKSPGEERLLGGVRGTFHQLMDALAKEGLEMVPGTGASFDPNVHEAVSGGGNGDLVVSAELRRGYTLSGRVIRPALVAVAPAADAEEAEPSA